MKTAIIALLLAGCLLGTKSVSTKDHARVYDYQLEINDSGTYIFDGARCVGFIPFDETQRLDSLLLTDNL